MTEDCDYCGEPTGSRTYSVFIPQNNDTLGFLCSPECQLSYSKYILGAGHAEREPQIRSTHKRVHKYAPSPHYVKKYNRLDYTPRKEWLKKE